ncbi:MAG TPA: class I SAM-dependent methyltransferase [Pseudonocardiaceae bacterium]
MNTWVTGDAYEAYVGRWSRPVAAEFVAWLDVPPGRRWVDVGCGTGALTGVVLATAAPSHVIGVDPSEPFLATARARLAGADAGAVADGIGAGGDGPRAGNAGPRAEFRVGDARALPLPDDAADAVVSGLALNFVPEPAVAAAEFARVTAPGGVAAAYVWDYAEGMGMMRHFWDVAVALDPAAADEAARFPVCHPDELTTLWSGAGLTGVGARGITVPTVFAGFDDYWDPFLGGQGPAPAYAMALPAEHRDALREALRERLPTAPDGTVRLTARAWAVRGTAPR